MAAALLLALSAATLAAIGTAQALAGWRAVRRFAAVPSPCPAATPGITVLKPLHGDEPMLEPALASFCAQDYPDFQIVFGVQDPADTALPVLARLRARFPRVAIDVVVDPTPHGANRKVGNLINMLPHARHDVLMIADSDIHAAPDLLRRVAAALEAPGTGLVTTLYTGRPARPSLAARLGASQITHGFLPGVLLARAAGRQDCLGATMTLRRDTLARIGGLPALLPHLADDAVLGRLVAGLGLGVRLAASVPGTTVPEDRLADLLSHELRWARTIRFLAPAGFALSVMQYPLAWALAAVLLSGGAPWAFGLFAAAWGARAAAVRGIDRALGLAPVASFWLLPLRDLLSTFVVLASYASDKVRWRGAVLRATTPEPAPRGG